MKSMTIVALRHFLQDRHQAWPCFIMSYVILQNIYHNSQDFLQSTGKLLPTRDHSSLDFKFSCHLIIDHLRV